MTSAAVVGCTGLVGSQILSTLLNLSSITTVTALARRPPSTPDPYSKIQPITSTDTSTWPTHLSTLSPPPSIFLSALGTTRAQAGSLAAQRNIDYDLNLSLARAAKEAGAQVYVLISSAAVSTSSPFPYSRMKAELEDAVKELDFLHTVIVKPGLLVGERRDSRPTEAVLKGIARVAGMVSGGLLKDFWAQDVDVIGRAAVSAGLRCLEGGAPEGKVWEVNQSEIIRLGRTEWKGDAGRALKA